MICGLNISVFEIQVSRKAYIIVFSITYYVFPFSTEGDWSKGYKNRVNLVALRMVQGLFPNTSEGCVIELEGLPDLLTYAQFADEIKSCHRHVQGSDARDHRKGGGANSAVHHLLLLLFVRHLTF